MCTITSFMYALVNNWPMDLLVNPLTVRPPVLYQTEYVCEVCTNDMLFA